MASGFKEQNAPWKVGIEAPRRYHSGLLAALELNNRAVATSGDYMQPFTADFSEHHILDARRGHSAPELASAAVAAPSAALADALATACMVLGSRASLQLLARLQDCAAHLITKNLLVIRVNGVRPRLPD